MSIKSHKVSRILVHSCALSLLFLEYLISSVTIRIEIYNFQLISHLLYCVRYLCYVCDLRHLKATIFAHFGTPRLAQSG